jgi:hypothetical protein
VSVAFAARVALSDQTGVCAYPIFMSNVLFATAVTLIPLMNSTAHVLKQTSVPSHSIVTFS